MNLADTAGSQLPHTKDFKYRDMAGRRDGNGGALVDGFQIGDHSQGGKHCVSKGIHACVLYEPFVIKFPY